MPRLPRTHRPASRAPGSPIDSSVPPNEQRTATRRAAFFDVDNTILRGNSSYHLGRALYARKFLTLRDVVRFSLMQMRYLTSGEHAGDMARLQTSALALVKGRSVAEMLSIGEDVYREVLAHRIFPGTKALIDSHLAAGDEVWLVTASPQEVGDLIASRVGATGTLGTRGEHIDGFYTGRLIGHLMHGAAKAAAVRELAEERGINLARSYAYGDSANDIPLLLEVGNPCGINADARLRRYCHEHSWPTRDFRGARRAVRRSLMAASWAGASWAIWTTLRSLASRWGLRH